LKVDFAGTNTRSNDGITAWQWDFGDGETSDQENPSHTYAKKGKYTVSLKVAEADGDTNTASSQDLIVVGPQPKGSSDSNPASPSESGQSEQAKIESPQSDAGGASPAGTKSQSLVESLGWLWVVMAVSAVMATIIIVDRRRKRKNEFDTLL
jgi:PKD repeat protein